MEINEKLASMSVKVVQTSSDFTYYIRGDVSSAGPQLSETESPEREIRRDEYFESDICPGLWFRKYAHDVEMNGHAGLRRLEFNILLLLNDGGGDVDIEYAKSRCWGKEPTEGTFKTTISTLNKKLSAIGVLATAQIENGRLLFG